MDAVARDAGVAVQTVYFTFHTKAELLIASLEIAGGEPGSPEVVMERAWIGRVIEAPTGWRRLALIVEHSNEIYARVGPAAGGRERCGIRGSGGRPGVAGTGRTAAGGDGPDHRGIRGSGRAA